MELSPEDAPAAQPLSPSGKGAERINQILTALLCAIAAWYFLWPVYRAFLKVEIDTNEGWNAFFADAAMGRAPLYPPPDQLITNNYPPVSFYVMGVTGRLLGDPLLAGRLWSLVAVLGLGVAAGLIARTLRASRAGAVAGGAFLIATLSRFFDRYVGMDDPQLLAQACMALAFAAFLRAFNKERSCLVPILCMVLAGFMKHNIIAMPFTAVGVLVFWRPREGLKCAVAATLAVVLGFAACRALYGHDFFANLLFSREYSWERVTSSLGQLKPLNVALGAALLLGASKWRERGVALCLIWTSVAFAANLLQRSGAGVDANAEFDLIIALSVVVALAITHAAAFRQRSWLPQGALVTLLLLALCLRFLPSRRANANRSWQLLFDPAFPAEIALREQAAAASVARVRATRGDVMTSNYICYRAGKPFAIDKFNAWQRMNTGALPADTVSNRLKTGRLTDVDADPLADWDNPVAADMGKEGRR